MIQLPDFRAIPLISKVCILLCALTTLLQAAIPDITMLLALSRTHIQELHLWVIVSHMFAHGGLFHLLANTLAFASFAPTVERRLGYKKFIALILAVGILTVPIHVLLTPIPAVGFSGVVCAIVTLFALQYPNTQIVVFIIPAKALSAMKFFTAISVIFMLFNVFPGIAHHIHLLGILVGYILHKYLTKHSNSWYYAPQGF